MLKPVEPFAKLYDYDSGKNEETHGEEEQGESLGIMTEVATVIFLLTSSLFLPSNIAI